MVVAHLGWPVFDLGCPFHPPVGQQVAAEVANQPGDLPKSESTQPRCATTMVTLYISFKRSPDGCPMDTRCRSLPHFSLSSHLDRLSCFLPFSDGLHFGRARRTRGCRGEMEITRLEIGVHFLNKCPKVPPASSRYLRFILKLDGSRIRQNGWKEFSLG